MANALRRTSYPSCVRKCRCTRPFAIRHPNPNAMYRNCSLPAPLAAHVSINYHVRMSESHVGRSWHSRSDIIYEVYLTEYTYTSSKSRASDC